MNTKSSQLLAPAELLAYPNSTFHITNHAIDDLLAFGDPRDKREFISRFERHLSATELRDGRRRAYPKYIGDVQLLAYCVLDNHFHLVLHQRDPAGIRKLMRSVTVSYGRYFNDRYGRRAQLFESHFDSKMVADPDYAKWVIAYVHLNHEVRGLDYMFCSHDYYVGRRSCDWVDSAAGLRVFGGREPYERYMARNADRVLEAKLAKRAALPKRKSLRPKRGPGSHKASLR